MTVDINAWSETPAANTSIDGINIGENCSPANVNNAIRSIAAGVKTFRTLFSTFTLTILNSADGAAWRTAIGAASAADLSGLPLNSVPVGAVVYYTKTTLPTGWLRCDGTAVSRTTYASLFAIVGTQWGVGDGSTTFNLPDLRGEFIRGYDDGRGVDASRVFGSAVAASRLATSASRLSLVRLA